jgi:hypothetical protein
VNRQSAIGNPQSGQHWNLKPVTWNQYTATGNWHPVTGN